MIWFKSELYGTTGLNCEQYIFVRSSRRVLGQYAWTRVRRVFPGIYRRVGRPFLDSEDMFFKLNKKKLRLALLHAKAHELEKRALRIRKRMAEEADAKNQ